MATEIKVPALGESITSGIIASWNVASGDYVQKDQVIYELETDKITSEGLAEAAGVITLKANEGDEVEIGQVIAEIDESADAPESAGKATPKSVETEPPAEPEPSTEPEPSATEKAPSPETKEEATEAESTSAAPTPSPKQADASAPKTAPTSRPSSDRVTRKRMSPLRRKIAERLVSAQQEAAMLTTFNEVDLTGIKALRAKYQESFVEKYGLKLGFMSFFVKAVVRALQDAPAINAMIDGDEVIQNHYYDIGIAVSTDKGLLVPVIRDCEKLSLAEIEREILNYANKAREGKIALQDLQGGVFTITNGGVFGSMLSTPILNPPQSGILGMHSIIERPIAIEGEVVIRPMMYLALSYDHRIVDGKEAVTFLVNIKQILENPLRLLVEV